VPWPKDHKAKIHEKIVAEASAALRSGGLGGVGVEDVMARVGLTHGAFYAHFRDKDELVREALEYAGKQTLERFSKAVEEAPAERRFAAAVEGYVSVLHAAHPELGCPVATLGPEVARAGGKTRRLLGSQIRQRLEWMRGLLPKRFRGAHADETVLGALACMVGAVVLARTVSGEESEAILEAARKFIDRAVGPSA
jgi:TetR/AcrR family transcriptional regulator, transcriptional repressor for nem operon